MKRKLATVSLATKRSMRPSLFRSAATAPHALPRYLPIPEAFALKIPDGNSLAVSSTCHSSFVSYIREGSVTIVSVERIPQRRIGIVEITLTTIDQIDVHPAIIVIVQERATGPGGFRQVVFRRFARCVLPGDPTHRRRNLLEGISRVGQRTGKARQATIDHSASKRFDEVAPGKSNGPLGGILHRENKPFAITGEPRAELIPGQRPGLRSSASSHDEAQTPYRPLLCVHFGRRPWQDCNAPRDFVARA